MGRRQLSVRRARRQRQGATIGYIVTWDADSGDAALCSRLRRFVFGYSLASDGRRYRYPGLVEKEGVRYLGQSVLFVTHARLSELRRFLEQLGVPHVVTHASLGAIMPG